MLYVIPRFRETCAAFTLLLCATAANGQVTFSAGNPPDLRFKAGPDFATDVLGDPWDFANGDDLSPHPDDFGGWVEFNAAKLVGPATAFLQAPGVFRGTSSTGDPQLTLLYRGGYNVVNPSGRSGIRYPIATSRYTKLAMRVTYGNTSPAGQAAEVLWFFYPTGHPSGGNFGTRFIGPADPGTRTHVADLASAPPTSGSPWTNQPFVRGLRIDPISGGSNVDMTIDWVRLTTSDGAGAANMFVDVACAANWSVVATDGGGDTLLGTGSGNSGHFALNYGVLPPGSYRLGLTCGAGPRQAGPSFTINAPATLRITSPGLTTGDEYATATLANGAWDMAQDGDIATAGHISEPSFVPSPTGRDFRARNLGDGSPIGGDPQVYLLAEANNSTPISSSRYRYLTFTLTVEGAHDLGAGSVARVFWSSTAFSSGAADTTSKDILVWPGRQTYTIDLARLSPTPDPIEGAGIEAGCAPVCSTMTWANRSARFLRLDPHEFPTPRSFQFGTVKLTAMSEVAIGETFGIRYRNEDPIFRQGDSHVVRFYADTDTDATTAGIPISSPITLTSPLAAGDPDRTFNWAVPANFAPGSYYIYAEITDAVGEVRGAFSEAPVRVFLPPTSSVAINVVRPGNGASVFAPFSIVGCAAKPGAGDSGVDDVLMMAIGGTDVAIPAQRGATFVLGETPTSPEFGLRYVNIPCPSGDLNPPADVAHAASAYTQSGFGVATVYGLSAGHWTLRVLARDATDGRIAEHTVPILVQPGTPPATNLRLLSASGNTVTIAWDPPSDGLPISGYRIDVSASATFASITTNVVLPASLTSGSGTLPDGVWYIRVVTLDQSGGPGTASNAISFSLPGGGPPAAPGTPTLTATQVSANPIVLTWAPGAGGAPSSYTLHAGTSSGQSNLGAFPMGGATSISAVAPIGTPLYLRVTATNSVGSSTSNEVNFQLAAPSAPSAPSLSPATVSGGNVSLTWTAGAGSAPTSFTVLARLAPTGPPAVALPLATTSLSIAAPPGAYYVSVQASNAAGTSAESNLITVIVP